MSDALNRQTSVTVRLDAWRSVFEKTNRIISGRPVTVQIVEYENIPRALNDVPGWSDGEAVHFNGKMLADMLKSGDPVSTVLRLKGLNYHELSHVLFTPRVSDELPKRVIEKAKESNDPLWWYAFNALEDQRIETWFSASYGASRRYFEAAVLQWLISDGKAEAAILMYGRKYLSTRLRAQAGVVFVKKHGKPMYDEFKVIIDAYLGIELPAQSIKALKLIGQYRDLLNKVQATGANLPPMVVQDNGAACDGGTPGKHTGDVVRKGRTTIAANREARDAAQREMERVAAADEAFEKDASSPGDSSADDGTEDGDGGDGGLPQGGSGEGQGESSSGEGAGGQQPGGQGAGSEAAEHEVMSPDESSLVDEMGKMIDQAYDGMDEIRQDVKVQEDVGKVLDAVRATAHDGKIGALGQVASHHGSFPPVSEHHMAARKIVQILTRIRVDTEPQVSRRMVNGRLNLRRILTRRPNEVDIFDQWDEGSEDVTGIEAVILLDVSGSMSGRTRDASGAVWALKRAFDKLEIKTTVLVFDTDHKVLYRASERASGSMIPEVNSGGGTNPASALAEGHKILLKSHEPNKLLITVTDGQWSMNAGECKQVMKSLTVMGATTMLLGLDNAAKTYGAHNHQISHDLVSINLLPKAALKIVTQILRAAASRP